MPTVVEQFLAVHERLRRVLTDLDVELAACAGGRQPASCVLLRCLDRCSDYLARVERVSGGLIGARMHRRDPHAARLLLGRMRHSQARLADVAARLRHALRGASQPGVVPATAVPLAAELVDEFRGYLDWEAASLLPVARRVLEARDWAAIEAGLTSVHDSLSGAPETVAPVRGPASAVSAAVGNAPLSARTVRFGDVMREVSLHEQTLSYNYLTPGVLRDGSGRESHAAREALSLRSIDVWRLLAPYVGVRLQDQLRAVVPLALYLALFQILILRRGVDEGLSISLGLVAVVVGLMLFMEGLKLGLMPFGELIGDGLPRHSPLWVVLGVAFVLGIGVTFAEPAIGALQAAGALVDVTQAPYLHALLNDWPDAVVLVVGMGVGLAAVLGTLRFLYGWSLKPYICITLVPTLLLTVVLALDEDRATILGLAWDCGAVTTGPVTVPLVLSLGIGIASAAGKGGSSLAGFGIVTLASLFPIIAVMLLGLYVSHSTTPEAIIAAAQVASDVVTPPAWYRRTPVAEIIGGVRAIVPLVLLLWLIYKGLLRTTLREAGIVAYGLVLCVLGMCVFNIGLTYGLSALGGQSGSLVPATFRAIDAVAGSPLYAAAVGVPVVVLFAWVLGFGATLAEPALNALGITVENLTSGAFHKSMLMYAVSVGVAFGIALGVLKIIHGIPIAYLLVPAYLLGALLTLLSSEEFVNVAWDSAGVTTGPVTVPLVLAMGLGLGDAVTAVEGFGLLSMASIGPILSVLAVGLWVQRPARRGSRKAAGA